MLQFLPYFWRTVLLCVLFPFSTFCLCLFSTYCLLSSKMSDKKSADILTGESLVLTIHFFLAAFKSLSFKCLFIMCLCGSLSSSSLEFKELLWYLYFSFTKTGKFSAIISSGFLSAPCFLSSPSGMYVAYVDSLHGVPKVLQVLFAFL